MNPSVVVSTNTSFNFSVKDEANWLVSCCQGKASPSDIRAKKASTMILCWKRRLNLLAIFIYWGFSAMKRVHAQTRKSALECSVDRGMINVMLYIRVFALLVKDSHNCNSESLPEIALPGVHMDLWICMVTLSVSTAIVLLRSLHHLFCLTATWHEPVEESNLKTWAFAVLWHARLQADSELALTFALFAVSQRDIDEVIGLYRFSAAVADNGSRTKMWRKRSVAILISCVVNSDRCGVFNVWPK